MSRATVAAAIACALLVGLGVWQVRRHFETAAKIQAFDREFDTQVLGAGDLARPEADRRRVRLEGRWAGPVRLVEGRVLDGTPGFDVFQTLMARAADRDDATVPVAVDRGFVPRDGLETSLAAIRPQDGDVTVDGLVVRLPGDAAMSADDAGPPERWAPEHVAGLVAVAGGPGVYVVAGQPREPHDPAPRELPRDGYVRPRPETRPHLQYAATWFLLAIAAVAIRVVAAPTRTRS